MLFVAVGFFYVGSWAGWKACHKKWLKMLAENGFLIDPEFGKAFTHVYFARNPEAGESRPPVVPVLPGGRPTKDRN